MPYMTVPRNGQYYVHKRGADGRPEGSALGKHETKEQAQAQIYAITQNEKKSRKQAPAIPIDLRPPDTAANVAGKGLALEGGRPHYRSLAEQIKRRDVLTLRSVKVMANCKAERDSADYLLCGGNPGQVWARGVLDRLDRERATKTMPEKTLNTSEAGSVGFGVGEDEQGIQEQEATAKFHMHQHVVIKSRAERGVITNIIPLDGGAILYSVKSGDSFFMTTSEDLDRIKGIGSMKARHRYLYNTIEEMRKKMYALAHQTTPDTGRTLKELGGLCLFGKNAPEAEGETDFIRLCDAILNRVNNHLAGHTAFQDWNSTNRRYFPKLSKLLIEYARSDKSSKTASVKSDKQLAHRIMGNLKYARNSLQLDSTMTRKQALRRMQEADAWLYALQKHGQDRAKAAAFKARDALSVILKAAPRRVLNPDIIPLRPWLAAINEAHQQVARIEMKFGMRSTPAVDEDSVVQAYLSMASDETPDPDPAKAETPETETPVARKTLDQVLTIADHYKQRRKDEELETMLDAADLLRQHVTQTGSLAALKALVEFEDTLFGEIESVPAWWSEVETKAATVKALLPEEASDKQTEEVAIDSNDPEAEVEADTPPEETPGPEANEE